MVLATDKPLDQRAAKVVRVAYEDNHLSVTTTEVYSDVVFLKKTVSVLQTSTLSWALTLIIDFTDNILCFIVLYLPVHT